MIKINIENDTEGDLVVLEKTVKKICISVLNDEGFNHAEVTFIFTDDESVRQLKKQFFNLDVYTDVITFNLEDKGEPLDGEIYISWDRVRENAALLNVNLDQELQRMIVHSSLHLVGYKDDSKELKSKMTALEEKYLSLSTQNIIQ